MKNRKIKFYHSTKEKVLKCEQDLVEGLYKSYHEFRSKEEMKLRPIVQFESNNNIFQYSEKLKEKEQKKQILN
jgi:hypothetical protein